MREVYGWDGHGEHRRHARDAAADAHAARAHDGPRHTANDALKLKMLTDPEARKKASLAAMKRADEAEAAYRARHARPKSGDQGQAPEQRGRPREARPERTPPETRDKPTSKIAAREDRLESQKEERPKPQRSWLPRAEAVKGITDIGAVIASVAVALGDVPAKWDAVAVCAASAVVSNLIWAHKREKGQHGDRPES